MSRNKRPILVTGSHRSGSTWIGRIIESSTQIRYVHEPFNIHNKRKYIPLNYWFEYISNATPSAYSSNILAYLKSFFNLAPLTLWRNIREIDSLKSGYHFLVDIRDRLTKRTLLKDPIALLSCEWISENINCDVIITIRHPAAFVASIKVKNWAFNFDHFLKQEELLKNKLSVYENDIRTFAKEERPIVEQAVLLWNIMYSVVAKYRSNHANTWYFVKHEDLSEEPMIQFQKMFAYLDIPFTGAVEKEILNTTTKELGTEHERNSKENRFTWKQRLTTSEIEFIKEKTFPVWSQYYSEEDWG